VLVCRPAQSEAHLSFAGLADLLEPVLGEKARSPARITARALEAALLLSEEEAAAGPADDLDCVSGRRS
jgi:hypothetical protein